MKRLDGIRQVLQDQKSFLQERYQATKTGVFGSYVREAQNRDSELDILIELERPSHISMIGAIELEDYLSELPSIQVELIKKNLRKRIGKRILEEVIPV